MFKTCYIIILQINKNELLQFIFQEQILSVRHLIITQNHLLAILEQIKDLLKPLPIESHINQNNPLDI
jgi:hypothetical protein